MFTYERTIRMRDTDAAGIVFFAYYPALAHEAYEAFLERRGIHLGRFLETTDYLIPVVHAEVHYRSPLRLADRVCISMACTFIGDSSFTLQFHLRRDGDLCAEVRTTHATVSRKTGRKISLPAEILDLLEPIKV